MTLEEHRTLSTSVYSKRILHHVVQWFAGESADLESNKDVRTCIGLHSFTMPFLVQSHL